MRGSMSENILSTSVARRFYLDGLSKSEIATELGISRFRVARLIERAVRDGVVRIEFNYPADEIDYELSASLQARTGLQGAVVVRDTAGDLELMLDRIGKVAANALKDLAGSEHILGVASNRVAEALARNLQPFANGAVVQLAGAWPGATGHTSVEMVHTVARVTSSPYFSFYAPLVASDVEAARAIRRQADVKRAAAIFPKVTTAVIGLGALLDGQTSLWEFLSEQEREETLAAGAIGEICGMTFGSEGQAIETPLSRRAIGISLEQLRDCPEVICLAFGIEKASAIAGAVRGRIVNTLITHATCARAIMDLYEDAESSTG